jgi:hypothetical protein
MICGLFVGENTQLKNKLIMIASVHLNEHEALSRLAKYGNNDFLVALRSLFQNQQFSTALLAETSAALLKRLPIYAADHNAVKSIYYSAVYLLPLISLYFIIFLRTMLLIKRYTNAYS